MTNEQPITMYEVFEYVWEVSKQTGRLIQDAAEALYKETRCYYKHMRAWDYTAKPNQHFLKTQFGISRAWVTYVPEGELPLAALFYVHFFNSRYQFEPALMYGSLDPGPGKDFEQVNRWASWYMITDVERKKEGTQVAVDGPFSIVTSTKENRFKEAWLVRVPLESLTSWEDLQRIVVSPLAALVRGEVEEARELLQDVETIQWPFRFAEADEEEEEEEIEEA